MKVVKRKWELISGNNAQNESAQEKKVVKRKWELISGNSAQNEGGQEKMGVNKGELRPK
ncbi:hypothetical protein [Cytobacillus sp. Bac17]|uniref:hypothetical protein n=1 Tax=Cytobacillus sp. Bac17 TaxID=2926008 RepID=UPI002118E4F5|nr:hypothetical protein [Cytobacillus sp. Bac17]